MTKKLSTGHDSTLGNWYNLTAATFGPASKPALYLQAKIAEQGEDEEVIADEGQFLLALVQMNNEPEDGLSDVGQSTKPEGQQ